MPSNVHTYIYIYTKINNGRAHTLSPGRVFIHISRQRAAEKWWPVKWWETRAHAHPRRGGDRYRAAATPGPAAVGGASSRRPRDMRAAVRPPAAHRPQYRRANVVTRSSYTHSSSSSSERLCRRSPPFRPTHTQESRSLVVFALFFPSEHRLTPRRRSTTTRRRYRYRSRATMSWSPATRL